MDGVGSTGEAIVGTAITGGAVGTAVGTGINVPIDGAEPIGFIVGTEIT